MKIYSIIPLNVNYVDEICEDIKEQYEKNVASVALFSMPLVPEGNPVINKAELALKKYDLFRDRLSEMGLKCGILVQCTIGHGYPLNEMFPFQKCINLNDGEAVARCCPYDEGVRDHFREVMKTLTRHNPETIMIDDDIRLLTHFGKGCACPLHMAEFNKRAGTNITRQELYDIIMDKTHKDCMRFREIFESTQEDSLLGFAKAIREGIDAVDPYMSASVCTAGTDPHGKIAEVLAGKHNPSIMRINNGAYSTPGMRNLSLSMYKAALQMSLEDNKADIYLAETDTCPQNRYSTSAHYVHTHFVGTILEGASGAKHWITRTMDFEPESGREYRRVLSKYAGMYEKLSQINKNLSWRGCNILLPRKMPYAFELPPFTHPHNAWSTCVLERLGLPLYFSKQCGGAMFFDSDYDKYFSDDEIIQVLKGTVILSSSALKSFNERGFAHLTGVGAKEWKGKPVNSELIAITGKKCHKQYELMELVPIAENVECLSHSINITGDITEHLFPAVTLYKNELGGTVIACCGTPDAPFHYTTGFSFLNYSRKCQFEDILKRTGNLPIYYPEDAEVYLKCADMPDGKMLCAVFNIGMDAIENLPLCIDKDVKTICIMTPEGEWENLSFEKEGNKYILNTTASILTPVILSVE